MEDSHCSNPLSLGLIDDKGINTRGKLHNLSDATIRQYKYCHKLFRKACNGLPVSERLVEELSKHCKFPRKVFKPKILPSKDQLRIFYDALPVNYKSIFLLLAESGLRIGELLDCSIDTENKMIIPNGHTGTSKHSWIPFYQTPFTNVTVH